MSGSSDDASFSSEDKFSGLSEDLEADEQEAEGVAKILKENFGRH